MSGGYLVNQKLQQIGRQYLTDPILNKYNIHLGALGIAGGTIITKAILHGITEGESTQNEIVKSINDDLDIIFQTIENSTQLSPTFCTGLAGTGWLMEYLKRLGIIDIDLDEFLEEIDEVLRLNLGIMIRNNYFDILHGYLGLGIYFLKRNKTEEVRKIITALNNCKTDTGNEIKWKSLSFGSGEPIYNFSLSHGNASILYFLGKCFSQNICMPECSELIDGLFKFYFNNLQDIGVQLSYFPNAISIDDYKHGRSAAEDSRLAWCYGDLGILHTMYLVSNWIGDNAIREKVVEMLLWEAKRRDKQDTLVSDAGFCHGSSGVGYIFSAVHNKTGILNFKEAADYWLDETVKRGKHFDKQAHGFLFPNNDVLTTDETVLTGLGGVFAFLSSLQSVKGDNSWNECLFLS
jgi:hypothetical protein